MMKRKRHLLNTPLSEPEVQTLQQMPRHPRYPGFRRRALTLLALNERVRRKPAAEILDAAAELARQESLTLGKIARKLQQQFP